MIAFWQFGDTLITADAGAVVSWYFDAARGFIAGVAVALFFSSIGLGLRRLIMPSARHRGAQKIGRLQKALVVVVEGVATGSITFAGLERWIAPGFAISVGLGFATGIAVCLVVGIALSFVVDIPPYADPPAPGTE